MTHSSRIRKLVLVGGLLIVAAFIVFRTPFLYNLLLLPNREFFIPVESSILTFRVTEMNPGSGDWWLAGEDRKNFYAYSESRQFKYHLFPKSKAAECPGFQPKEPWTWCPSFTTNVAP